MADSIVPGTTRSLAAVLSRMRTAGLVGGSTTDTSSIAAARAAWRGYIDRSADPPVLVDEAPPTEAEVIAEAEAWEAEMTTAEQEETDDATRRAAVRQATAWLRGKAADYRAYAQQSGNRTAAQLTADLRAKAADDEKVYDRLADLIELLVKAF